MLKKTCAASGLLIATAAGALLTSSPASAQAPNGGGWGRFHHSFRFLSRQHNLNANENANLNRIRIRLRNNNNNIAVARADRERERERDERR